MISKEVQLPKHEATLTAYAIPKPAEGAAPYSYEWKLLSFTKRGGPSSPSDAGALKEKEGSMKNAHSPQLELSGLEQGVYQFRVTVDAGGDAGAHAMHGEALANVSVLPRE